MISQSDYAGKRLFLLRHAAAMPQSDGGDKGRALSEKGQEDALALGRMMAERGYTPDIALCSPALRTRQTLENVKRHVQIPHIVFPDTLYDGTKGDYLREIQNVDDAHRTILLVAHNPNIYELVLLLAAQKGNNSVMQRLMGGYKPASLSVLHCACERWADIQPSENDLVRLADPMDYNAPARPTRWM